MARRAYRQPCQLHDSRWNQATHTAELSALMRRAHCPFALDIVQWIEKRLSQDFKPEGLLLMAEYARSDNRLTADVRAKIECQKVRSAIRAAQHVDV